MKKLMKMKLQKKRRCWSESNRKSRGSVRKNNPSWEGKQLLSGPKLGDSTSIESGQCLQSYSTLSTSFANRNRGKNLHSTKCSINPTPIALHHLYHTTTYLIISHHHLHITNSFNPHLHLYHNSTPRILKVRWPTTYN
jgi:hypothetical protein